MSKSFPTYVDVEDPVVKSVLNTLWKFQILTYEQLIQLEFAGDRSRGYPCLHRLCDAGLIRSRKHPDDLRVSCAVLLAEGMRAIGQTPKALSSLHKDRMPRLLAINDLHIRLLFLGIPPEAMAERRDVLEDLKVAPQYTKLAMRVTGVDKQWLLYLREKGVRRKLLQSTNVVPGDLGHVVLYDKILAGDIREFLEQSIPKDYHVLQMDDLPLFGVLAFEPGAFKARMSEYMSVRYPGKMVRLEHCLFDYAWERNDGARLMLADASANNLGPVKAVRDLDIDYAKNAGWGRGVVLFAKDEKAAQLWLKVIGPREWLRLVRYDLPPGKAFFEAVDGDWRSV